MLLRREEDEEGGDKMLLQLGAQEVVVAAVLLRDEVECGKEGGEEEVAGVTEHQTHGDGDRDEHSPSQR